MIYTPKTKLALKLCFEGHKDQLDKSGLPYVFHPFHLAEQMETEETAVVALLHDLVEDTSTTFEDLEAMGFGEKILTPLRLLTHLDDTPYMEYIAKIKEDPIAKAVKLADLRHNSDLSRMEEDAIDQWALERNQKYKRALAFLLEE